MSYKMNQWVLRLTATTFALFGLDLVGVLEGVNYNQIWFQFITTFLNLIRFSAVFIPRSRHSDNWTSWSIWRGVGC